MFAPGEDVELYLVTFARISGGAVSKTYRDICLESWWTKRDVMSCLDICLDTGLNACARSGGTHFGEKLRFRDRNFLFDSCPFDVVFCDFRGSFEMLSDVLPKMML